MEKTILKKMYYNTAQVDGTCMWLFTIYHKVKEVRVVNTCMLAHVKTGIILQLHVARVDNIEYIVYEHD